MTRRPANPTIVAVLWLAAALVFFIAEGIAAAAVAPPYHYSYTRDFISQLGVPGWTGLAAVMNVGFVLQGALFLAGAVLAVRESTTGHRRSFIVLVTLNALGDLLVATNHDAASVGATAPSAGHWLGTILAIPFGNAAIIVGSGVLAGLVRMRWYRVVSICLGVLGFLSLLILGNAIARPHIGFWERGCVYSILVWQILSAVVLLVRRHADTRAAVLQRGPN